MLVDFVEGALAGLLVCWIFDWLRSLEEGM